MTARVVCHSEFGRSDRRSGGIGSPDDTRFFVFGGNIVGVITQQPHKREDEVPSVYSTAAGSHPEFTEP